MIYLASPYSDPDPTVMQERFEQVTRVAAFLISEGEVVFAPITYGHPIAELTSGPTDAAAWQAFNEHMFNLADEIMLLGLDGWSESKGVAMELQWATERGLTVEVLNPKNFAV